MPVGLRRAGIAACALVALLPACRYEPAPSGRASSAAVAPATVAPVAMVGPFEELEIPAGVGAGQAYVAPAAGAALVSWLEPAGEGRYALKFAHIDGTTPPVAKVIAERDDFFVNFADFPSILDADGVLFAHWLQKRGPGTYAYDVRLAASRDGGDTWSNSIVVHDDGLLAEHGFASLVPLARAGTAGVVWLDGRHMTGEGEGHSHSGGDMTLRYAEVDASLVVTAAAELDARTCECCATTMAMTSAGPFVAYRDRSEYEVRDISAARFSSGEWRAGAAVAGDGWKIHGCPVNGPQADARGDVVALAWFTAADDRPRVRLAFSSDAGASFGAPVEIAAEGAMGYVDCAFVAEDRVAISWLDDDGAQARLRMREVLADGTLLPVTTIATTTRGRTGFPRLAVSGRSIFVVWNEKGDTPKIHLARAFVAQ